jgi:hypothetical protein
MWPDRIKQTLEEINLNRFMERYTREKKKEIFEWKTKYKNEIDWRRSVEIMKSRLNVLSPLQNLHI